MPHFSWCGVLGFAGVQLIFFTVAREGVAVLWICAGNRVDHTEMFSGFAEEGSYRAKAFSASSRDAGGFGYWWV